MKYRRVGNSGIKVSELSFGSWVTFGRQLDEDAATRLMGVAYDAGVNFFDNAEVYNYGESERIMGVALRKLGWPRDSYLVSSKVRWGSVPDPKPTQLGLSRKHILAYSPLASGLLTGKYTAGIPEGSRAALADYGWPSSERIWPQPKSSTSLARSSAG